MAHRNLSQMLAAVAKANSGSPIEIFLTQVDPDGAGSAVGLYWILKALGIPAEAYYFGAIGHPQNRSIFNVCGLTQLLRPIALRQLVPGAAVPRCAFVDSSDLTDSRLGDLCGKVNPVIVIDHHDTTMKSTPDKFIWVERVGAASTLVVELLREFGDKIPAMSVKAVATVLAMGIYSDTKALVNAGPRDLAAYGWITDFVNPEELNWLIRYDLPSSHFTNFHHALDHVEKVETTLVASCGYLTEADGDDVSTIADEFIRMEGVNLVFVWSIEQKGVRGVRVSVRSRNPSLELSGYMRKLFGRNGGAKQAPNGQGEGGAFVPLGHLDIAGTEAEMLALATKYMQLKVYGQR